MNQPVKSKKADLADDLPEAGKSPHTPMMQHYLDVYYFPFVFNALNLR